MSSRTGVVVVSHGEAGLSMVDTAERVLGKLDVRTVAVRIGEPRLETEARIESVCEELGSEELLFLVDLEGSTPYNLCCRKCRGSSVVLSGINLPMLFKLATADREHGALALAEELKATALKSIHIRAGQTAPAT